MAADRFGLIHADLRAANLLVAATATGPPTITRASISTTADYSWFLYDLAASVSFLEHRPELPELVAGWLAGYRARLAPSTATISPSLPSLVMLRRLQLLAWSAATPRPRWCVAGRRLRRADRRGRRALPGRQLLRGLS